MIETPRLRLHPLTHAQLLKYLENDNSLEAELNLNPTTRSISPELKEALDRTLVPNVANPAKNYLFCTLWTLIDKTDNRMVGDLCIVDEPNEDGEIEIGYGTYDTFKSKGFMTEAVGGIIQWAANQSGVQSIIASTEKNNFASFKVLEKNKFALASETQEVFTWKFDLNDLKSNGHN